jgi:ubiquinol-cytochrome c reductase iron-sulfur subunit
VRAIEGLLRAVAVLRGARGALGDDAADAPEPVDPRRRAVPGDRRAETLVALLLLGAGAGGAAFALAIALGWSAQAQGAAAGGALLLLAAALGLAGRRVVVQETDVEERPPRGDPQERARLRDAVARGAEGVTRRRLLAASALAAAAGRGAAVAAPLSALGPAVGDRIARTPWRRGRRLVDAAGRPITAQSIAEGGFRTAFPEGADRRRLDAPVIVVRVDPATLELPPGRAGWAPGGLVAYSKTCTHAGCAVGMFRSPSFEDTQPRPALACPCHYSVFDVRRGARVIEGPAGRPLPQLPLRIGARGELRAGGGLSGPPGPAWWGVRRA